MKLDRNIIGRTVLGKPGKNRPFLELDVDGSIKVKVSVNFILEQVKKPQRAE
jgi:hypothetical protein